MPATGQRHSIKIYGCVEIFTAHVYYRRRNTVSNALTYLAFIEQVVWHYYPHPVIWIQDNASYHRDGRVVEWFEENRD